MVKSENFEVEINSTAGKADLCQHGWTLSSQYYSHGQGCVWQGTQLCAGQGTRDYYWCQALVFVCQLMNDVTMASLHIYNLLLIIWEM